MQEGLAHEYAHSRLAMVSQLGAQQSLPSGGFAEHGSPVQPAADGTQQHAHTNTHARTHLRLGLLKLLLKTSHCLRCSCRMTSACTRGVAVAVSAMTGTWARHSTAQHDAAGARTHTDTTQHMACIGCLQLLPQPLPERATHLQQAEQQAEPPATSTRDITSSSSSTHLREACLEQAQPLVVRPEVMAPLQAHRQPGTGTDTRTHTGTEAHPSKHIHRGTRRHCCSSALACACAAHVHAYTDTQPRRCAHQKRRSRAPTPPSFHT